ncbi:MAG: tRNA epoxyqueuosine(34) reductase QueG [Rhodospirillales bacterium]|nr:tRNA epoxyqueuosine(34) reductase QueG [Rhodospirillales bacterium]
MTDITLNIRKKALECGFDAVGITRANAIERDAEALNAFLKQGLHGDMAWMMQKADRRIAPTALWPEAKSVIVLGLNYAPRTDPLAIHQRPDRGAISVYAQGKDYHDIVKKRLKMLARWIVENNDCEVKVFVDTAPVMEKPLAARAGLGWQGKHSNLVSRQFGSWMFLGEVFTTLELSPDEPETDHCGTCDLCVKACPTGALDEPYRLNATRCISYLNIETKDHIDEDLMSQMGNRIYGCDDCLSVCPWNKFETSTTEEAFLPRPELNAPRLSDLLELDDATFREVYSGSPVKRTGRERMVRNALIAAGNSRLTSLLPSVQKLQNDSSEMVRDAAKWAEKEINS